jgi:hypothetical protein
MQRGRRTGGRLVAATPAEDVAEGAAGASGAGARRGVGGKDGGSRRGFQEGTVRARDRSTWRPVELLMR